MLRQASHGTPGQRAGENQAWDRSVTAHAVLSPSPEARGHGGHCLKGRILFPFSVLAATADIRRNEKPFPTCHPPVTPQKLSCF